MTNTSASTRSSYTNHNVWSKHVPTVPTRTTYAPSSLPTPILAVDVDGPLNPFRMSKNMLRRGGFVSTEWRSRVTYASNSTWCPYTDLHLARAVGDMLSEFSRIYDVELVWCSLWEHNANTVIAPALGLPRLRWVDFHGHSSRLWKWDAVAEFAANRPLCWLDDSFNEPRKEAQRCASGFDRARRGLPTLLHRVSPVTGLTGDDLFGDVASWLHTARLAW